MKKVEKSGELSTILGRGSVFEGNIKVEHSLRIDGRVKGDVTTSDTLIIGKEGEVIGNVKVKSLVVGGRVDGTVDASTKIVLENKAVFRGEMNTNKLVIDEGAIFEGKCSMKEGKTSQPDTPEPGPTTSHLPNS